MKQPALIHLSRADPTIRARASSPRTPTVNIHTTYIHIHCADINIHASAASAACAIALTYWRLTPPLILCDKTNPTDPLRLFQFVKFCGIYPHLQNNSFTTHAHCAAQPAIEGDCALLSLFLQPSPRFDINIIHHGSPLDILHRHRQDGGPPRQKQNDNNISFSRKTVTCSRTTLAN